MRTSRGDDNDSVGSDERALRGSQSRAWRADRRSALGARGSRRRAALPLRFLLRVAMAIATLVVFGGIAGRTAGASLVAAAYQVAACESVESGTSSSQASQASHHWKDRTPRRPAPDLKAVELDDDSDDDDDSARDGTELAALSFRCALDRCAPRRALRRGELQVDTSRFAAGIGLPRGPPA